VVRPRSRGAEAEADLVRPAPDDGGVVGWLDGALKSAWALLAADPPRPRCGCSNICPTRTSPCGQMHREELAAPHNAATLTSTRHTDRLRPDRRGGRPPQVSRRIEPACSRTEPSGADDVVGTRNGPLHM
jgi:hypothetical protein